MDAGFYAGLREVAPIDNPLARDEIRARKLWPALRVVNATAGHHHLLPLGDIAADKRVCFCSLRADCRVSTLDPDHMATAETMPFLAEDPLGDILPGSKDEVEVETAISCIFPGSGILRRNIDIFSKPTDELILDFDGIFFRDIVVESANEPSRAPVISEILDAMRYTPGDAKATLFATDRAVTLLTVEVKPSGSPVLASACQPACIRTEGQLVAIPGKG